MRRSRVAKSVVTELYWRFSEQNRSALLVRWQRHGWHGPEKTFALASYCGHPRMAGAGWLGFGAWW